MVILLSEAPRFALNTERFSKKHSIIYQNHNVCLPFIETAMSVYHFWRFEDAFLVEHYVPSTHVKHSTFWGSPVSLLFENWKFKLVNDLLSSLWQRFYQCKQINNAIEDIILLISLILMVFALYYSCHGNHL